jgi:hypothetical protein
MTTTTTSPAQLLPKRAREQQKAEQAKAETYYVVERKTAAREREIVRLYPDLIRAKLFRQSQPHPEELVIERVRVQRFVGYERRFRLTYLDRKAEAAKSETRVLSLQKLSSPPEGGSEANGTNGTFTTTNWNRYAAKAIALKRPKK